MLILFRILGRLPLPLLHAIGVGVGWIAYAASPRYRRMLRENLYQAVGPAADGLWRKAVGEAGKSIFETPWVWSQDQARAAQAVRRVSGWDTVEAAQAAGESLFFITPHLGCFEIAAQYFAVRGGPLTVLFRRPRQSALAPLMDAGRSRGRLRAVPADGAGVRSVLKALKTGEAIAVLPDQVPRGNEGVWVPFFGRPAYTMTLAARIAAHPRTRTVLAAVQRLPWGRGYHLHLEPLTLPPGDTTARTAALNTAIEGLILKFPEQYLWGYNRYKRPADLPASAAPAKDAS